MSEHGPNEEKLVEKMAESLELAFKRRGLVVCVEQNIEGMPVLVRSDALPTLARGFATAWIAVIMQALREFAKGKKPT